MAKVTNSLIGVRDYLNKNFLERKEEVNGLLTALIARENVLLIGQPGTGKSNLTMELSKTFDGISYFQWLLTKYSVPEEIFGAYILDELAKGHYVRNTSNKLPEAHIAFLDEIFKSSSAILNSLLTIINEGIFYNNGTPVQCPIMTVIGASNEYPEDEDLDALDDRFILRYEVKQITEDANLLQVLKSGIDTSKRPSIDLIDLIQLQALCDSVQITDDMLNTVLDIKRDLEKDSIEASTRRWVKALKLVKASAVMNGRTTADYEDLEILKHSLWRKPEEMQKVQGIVKKFCYDKITSQVQDIVNMADDIKTKAMANKNDTATATESTKKLKQLTTDLSNLQKANPAKSSKIEQAMLYVNDISKSILKECLGVI